MPLFYCPKCQSEWEGKVGQKYCQWCGTEGYMLEEETSISTANINWIDFCKSLFPKIREHTPEERKAYSNFINSYFQIEE